MGEGDPTLDWNEGQDTDEPAVYKESIRFKSFVI
jgi:hypothetical protein